jgi:hypothetical protein
MEKAYIMLYGMGGVYQPLSLLSVIFAAVVGLICMHMKMIILFG